jgi:hypothetical protein
MSLSNGCERSRGPWTRSDFWQHRPAPQEGREVAGVAGGVRSVLRPAFCFFVSSCTKDGLRMLPHESTEATQPLPSFVLLQVFQAQTRQHERAARPLDDRDTLAAVERLAARDKRVEFAESVKNLSWKELAGQQPRGTLASSPCDDRSLGR